MTIGLKPPRDGRAVARFLPVACGLSAVLAFLGAALWAGPALSAEPAAFHIGLMTGSGVQSREELRGAREIIRLHGDAAQGGLVRHVTYPDNFMKEAETMTASLLALADDPLMKVIVVNQAVMGTAEAFQLIRQKRPDIFLLAGEAQEDIKLISETADLVAASDFVARGYLLPHSARELGARTFVHISFPRHLIDEAIARRRAIMEEACRDLGLRFVTLNVPDPMSEAGVAGARRHIMENFPDWLEEFGPATAFFATNDAQTEPLIRSVAAHGGYFIEADMPSPLLGFPEALGLNLERAEASKIMGLIEEAVLKAGAGGRLGAWAYSLGYTQTAALTEFGKLLAEGRAGPADRAALLQCYEKFSPGAQWNGNYYLDPRTGAVLGNYFMVYQDTYIFGRGFLGASELEIPSKYMYLQGKSKPRPAFHIGLATGSTAQGADDFLGAREMIRLYGEADQGGLIRHVIYPDKFMDEPEETLAAITGLAGDPLIKVVVVNQAIPGTAEAFRRIRAARPDILLLAGEAHEDADEISAAADLTVSSDFVSRGYLIPHSAKLLGAKNLVHISFPRHLSYESMGRRLAVMAEACADLGLNFIREEAPDPTGPPGVKGAQDFIIKKYPEWIAKYGPETAFFATNDAHVEPLLRQAVALGGLFVEADIPSSLLGFPETFGLDIKGDSGDWPGILRLIEEAAVKSGAGGRLGVWAYPLGFCQTAGLAEFGKLATEGLAKLTETDKLLECFNRFSPGAKWNGAYYTDMATGKPLRNVFQVYQDTYIFGRGYLNATSLDIPDKYFLLGKEHDVQDGAKN